MTAADEEPQHVLIKKRSLIARVADMVRSRQGSTQPEAVERSRASVSGESLVLRQQDLPS